MRVGIASTEAQLLRGQEQVLHLQEVKRLFGKQAAYRMVCYSDNPQTVLDVAVASIKANQLGIDVSVVLIGPPACPDPLDFCKWAGATMGSLPAANRFVLWNEVNSRAFWRGTPEDYAKLARAFSTACYPNRPWSTLALARSHSPLYFLNAYKAAGGPVPRLSAHLYGYPGEAFGARQTYLKRLRTAIGASTPLELDEVGVPGAPPIEYYQMFNLARSVQAGSLLFYRLCDVPLEIKTGLRSEDGVKKPAYEAVRLGVRIQKWRSLERVPPKL